MLLGSWGIGCSCCVLCCSLGLPGMYHFYHPRVELRIMPLSTFFDVFFRGDILQTLQVSFIVNFTFYLKCWCTFITANQSGPIWKRKVVFNSTKLNWHPPKQTWNLKKTTLGQGDSYWKPSFPGSMLNLGGVYPPVFSINLTQQVHQWTSPPPMTGLPVRRWCPSPPQAKATLNQSHERCPRPTQKQSFKQLQVGTGWVPSRWGWKHYHESFERCVLW